MKVDKMPKEELELLSYKEITSLILEEKGSMTTLDLFNKIAKLLDLPKSTVEKKIGDFYTTLSTDKNFLLVDGKWDLRKRHTSDKVLKAQESEVEDEEEEEIEEEIEDKSDMMDNEDNYDSQAIDGDDFDDTDDDLKDLVIIDEDRLDLEQ